MADLIKIELTKRQAEILHDAIDYAIDLDFCGYINWEAEDVGEIYGFLSTELLDKLKHAISSS